MRIFREIEVWGTVLLLDIASPNHSESELDEAVAEVTTFVHHVDRIFSPFKEDSEVCRIRSGELSLDYAHGDLREVWQLCLDIKSLTYGAFDPWKIPGGFDPSGIVKGWAADKCADIILAHNIPHLLINASGDITVRGGELIDGKTKPWTLGVTDPDNKENIVTTFSIANGAIATSGDYEKGAHITDPFTGLIAIGARSVTIVGPSGAYADALATAVMVSGMDGAPWFDHTALGEYEVFAINRHNRISWRYCATR